MSKYIWKPPKKDGGSPITGYNLEMKSSSDIKWKKVTEGIEDTKYTVEGLTEGTSYEFRVQAENKAGASQPSKGTNAVKYGKLKYCLV